MTTDTTVKKDIKKQVVMVRDIQNDIDWKLLIAILTCKTTFISILSF